MARGNGSTRLDSDKIVTAALAVADRHGLSGMTLRMVGSELGADPTAIYRHFSSKDALVLAMADRLFSDVAAADYPGDWRARFKALMRASRDIYCAHPTLVDALANQPEERRSIAAVNELSVACLIEAGLEPARAGLFHQMLSAYVIGSGLLDAAWLTSGDGAREASRRAYSALDPKAFPGCLAVGKAMFPDADDVLDFATEVFLDAITRAAAEPRRPHKPTRSTARKKA